MNHFQRMHILSTIDLMDQCLRSLRLALATKDPSVPAEVKSMSPAPEIGDRFTSMDEEKSISDMIDDLGKDMIVPGEGYGQSEEIA